MSTAQCPCRHNSRGASLPLALHRVAFVEIAITKLQEPPGAVGLEARRPPRGAQECPRARAVRTMSIRSGSLLRNAESDALTRNKACPHRRNRLHCRVVGLEVSQSACRCLSLGCPGKATDVSSSHSPSSGCRYWSASGRCRAVGRRSEESVLQCAAVAAQSKYGPEFCRAKCCRVLQMEVCSTLSSRHSHAWNRKVRPSRRVRYQSFIHAAADVVFCFGMAESA